MEIKENKIKVINFIDENTGKIGTQTFYRVGVYNIDDVLSFLTKYTNEKYQNYDGFEVKMSSQRYELFDEMGTNCVACGLKGDRFCLERNTNQSNKYHFNLYGTDEKGREIMITKDHIVLKSKGGKNNLNNYQPMCIVCNHKKADNLN